MSQVALHTNHGVITLQLNAEKAPKTVANFLSYVKKIITTTRFFTASLKDL